MVVAGDLDAFEGLAVVVGDCAFDGTVGGGVDFDCPGVCGLAGGDVDAGGAGVGEQVAVGREQPSEFPLAGR